MTAKAEPNGNNPEHSKGQGQGDENVRWKGCPLCDSSEINVQMQTIMTPEHGVQCFGCGVYFAFDVDITDEKMRLKWNDRSACPQEQMMKLTEKQLYSAWLDIRCADELYANYLSDMKSQIKEIRAAEKKTKRLLKKAAEHYKMVYGREPWDGKR